MAAADHVAQHPVHLLRSMTRHLPAAATSDPHGPSHSFTTAPSAKTSPAGSAVHSRNGQALTHGPRAPKRKLLETDCERPPRPRARILHTDPDHAGTSTSLLNVCGASRNLGLLLDGDVCGSATAPGNSAIAAATRFAATTQFLACDSFFGRTNYTHFTFAACPEICGSADSSRNLTLTRHIRRLLGFNCTRAKLTVLMTAQMISSARRPEGGSRSISFFRGSVTAFDGCSRSLLSHIVCIN